MRVCRIGILFGCFLSGCALVPVGNVEQIPESQRAKIYFYSDKGISTSAWKVDEVDRGIFALGHIVAPGKHIFRNDVESKVQDCVQSGYNSGYGSGGYGGTGSYGLGGTAPCFEIRYTGQCDGTITAEPGKSYAIRASGSAESIYLSVTDESDDRAAGYGSCNVSRY